MMIAMTITMISYAVMVSSPPLVTKRVKAKRHLFPSCRELCSGIILTHIYLSRQRTVPALTFVCSCGIMTAGRAVFRARHPLASSKHRNRRVGVSYTAVCLSILRDRDEQSNHRQNDHEEFIVRHAAPPPSVVTSSGR